ncbi:MAG: hypothetical protein KGO96_10590 [Elusimicrobia bacterium]|nr:hypothetical protein [Elusimicrobiota bacterium]
MSDLPLLTADQPSIAQTYGSPQWGIYDQSGNPVLTVDSVADIEYARDYVISDYPQEQGGFESFNKVQTPFIAKLGFLISTTRQQFLSTIEAANASLQLVSVVTPEVTYPSGNITHYGFRRTQKNGVTMIRVEVWVEEVRIIAGQNIINAANVNVLPGQANAGSSNPSTAGSSATSNGGTVLGPAISPNSQSIGGLVPGGALTTQSTNGASPQQSGLVQSQSIQSLGSQASGISNGLPVPD